MAKEQRQGVFCAAGRWGFTRVTRSSLSVRCGRLGTGKGRRCFRKTRVVFGRARAAGGSLCLSSLPASARVSPPPVSPRPTQLF